jgi:hypothetical protein
MPTVLLVSELPEYVHMYRACERREGQQGLLLNEVQNLTEPSTSGGHPGENRDFRE